MSFFSLVQRYYPLSTIQNLVIRQPLFDSWNARQTKDKIMRDDEDIETPDEHVDVAGPENPLLDPDQPKYPQLPHTAAHARCMSSNGRRRAFNAPRTTSSA